MDQFPLSISDGVHRVTSLLRIEIEPVDDQKPALQSGLTTHLLVAEGGQVQIGTDNLAASDNDTNDDWLSFVVLRPPTKGVIMRDREQVRRFTQRDVKEEKILYVHSGDEIGDLPQIDLITFLVTDKDDHAMLHPSQLPTQSLNVTIIPQNNKKPSVILGKSPLVVSEGDKVVLTTKSLNAGDPDSPLSDLLFMIIQQPSWGYIEDTKPHKVNPDTMYTRNAVSSFTLKSLKRGSIWYVQSNHSKVEPKSDMFEVYVTDGQMNSAPAQVNIRITPQNDEIPSLSTRDINVTEGARVTIDENAIKVSDLDDPEEKVVLSIASQPEHGQLSVLNMMYSDAGGVEMPMHEVNAKEFLRNMQLVYKHDGTEHYKDKFTIKITDGQYTVKKTIDVHVKPVNDQMPEVIKNQKLKVEYGESTIVSRDNLHAIDSDNKDDEIIFAVTKFPKKGILEVLEKVLDDKTEVWTSVSKNFTQADISAGHFRYTHTGQLDGTSSGMDYLQFYITDGKFQQAEQLFQIEIEHFRNGDLAVLNRGLDVREGTRSVLTTSCLSAIDDNSADKNIIYTIISPPRYGQLELVAAPGVAVLNFSQTDLVAHTIAYSHTAKEYSSEDVIVFVVTNGGGNVKKGIFVIRIEPVDVALPSVKMPTEFKVKQGSLKVISFLHLKASDPDTSNDKLTFNIVKLPKYGKLYNKDKVVKNSFTQENVNNNSIFYKHDSSDVELDNFTFSLSDGRHSGFMFNDTRFDDPLTFPMFIESAYLPPPIILINKQPETLEKIGRGDQGFTVKSKYLKSISSLDRTSDLQYVITERPLYGYLENTRLHKVIKRKFTQKDVDRGDVLYLLGEDVQATNDSFQFRVEDKFGNTLNNQR